MITTSPRPERVQPAYLAETHTGLPMPSRPSFDSVTEERRNRKQRLAAAVRLFGKHGFAEGISGHISVRDPEHRDRFWVNPFGVPFTRVRVRDLICVDQGGDVVEGHHRVNPSAFVIHSEIHRLRPDAEAAAHGHAVNARALGALHRLLDPLDQESAAFYLDQILYTEYRGPSISLEQGTEIAERLGTNRAILLAHHGLITVGGSLEEAMHWFFTYDDCALVQLLAMAAGRTRALTHEQAMAAKDGFGDALLGWFSFQLRFAEITVEQPDLLEE